jgi:hypothetical protein
MLIVASITDTAVLALLLLLRAVAAAATIATSSSSCQFARLARLALHVRCVWLGSTAWVVAPPAPLTGPPHSHQPSGAQTT